MNNKMQKKLAYIYCQEILNRELNSYDFADIDSWIENYDGDSLKNCIIDLMIKSKKGEITIYSTNYINNYLKSNCQLAKY